MKNFRIVYSNRHRYLLTGILCLFGFCLVSAQEQAEKKKTRVDLLYAEEAMADEALPVSYTHLRAHETVELI